jgi:hypothetical protein
MKDSIKEGRLHEINIGRMKKKFKMHWSAIDFNEKFINYCFQKLIATRAATKAKRQEHQQKTTQIMLHNLY